MVFRCLPGCSDRAWNSDEKKNDVKTLVPQQKNVSTTHILFSRCTDRSTAKSDFNKMIFMRVAPRLADPLEPLSSATTVRRNVTLIKISLLCTPCCLSSMNVPGSSNTCLSNSCRSPAFAEYNEETLLNPRQQSTQHFHTFLRSELG